VSRTVGVFDSGMGGLTVLRELLAARVAPQLRYLGDTARLPYGTKSPETVRRYALTLGRHLLEQGVDLLVVACNTASAVAIEPLREQLGVPVIGVVEPGARAAVAAGGPIGVLATEATVASGAYVRAIAALDPELEVRTQACPLFVPLVEEGWIEGEVPRAVARRYLDQLGDVQTLLLGCTHYPMLAAVLRRLRPDAAIVDAASGVTTEVIAHLGATGSGATEVRYSVTDGAARFVRLGARILGTELGDVELVDV